MFKKIFIILLFLLICSPLFAATRTWDGGGANDYWDTDNNWSDNTKPASGDTAVFDNTSDDNCVIKEAISVGNVTININSGYDGTFTQGFTFNTGTGVITVSSGTYTGTANLTCGGFTVSGGAVTLGGTCDINGAVARTSGSLTLSSGNTSVFGNFSGTFTNNSGTVIFDGTKTVDTASSFYKLSVINIAQTVTLSQAITVSNTFTCGISGNNITIDGYTINCNGDFETVASCNNVLGTTEFEINGTGDQTVKFSTVSSTYYISNPIEINKESGTVTWQNVNHRLSGNLTFTAGDNDLVGTIYYKTGTITYTAGTIDAGTSILTIEGDCTLNTNGIDWYSVTNSGYYVTLSSNLTTLGMLDLDAGATPRWDGYVINVKGDIKNTRAGWVNGNSTTKLIINGTGTQTYICLTNNLDTEISKDSGTLNITPVAGTCYYGSGAVVARTWLWTKGTVNAGTSTFLAQGNFTLNSDGMTFNNFGGNGASTITLPSNLTITGNMTSVVGDLTFNTSTSKYVYVAGNVGWAGGNRILGSSKLILNTATSQTLGTGTGALNINTDINATGTVTLSGITEIQSKTFTYIAGTVDPGTSTLESNIATLDLDGMSLYNFKVIANTTLASTLDINNDLTIDNVRVLNSGGYQINVGGNWVGTGAFTHENNTVIFDTVANTSVISGTNTFYNLTCNTASKVLHFASGVTQTIANDLTLNGQAKSTKIMLDRDGGTGTDRFTFNVTKGAQTVDFVNVANSNASTNNITALQSKNSGNTDRTEAAPHWIIQGGAQVISVQ
jgi:hypothetical protein